METVTLDDVDRGLLHALQIDGRVPMRALGPVLGVSENTVARRYQRLRTAGVLKITGAVSGGEAGYTTWTLRLRTTPDAGAAVAAALADRPDVSWVHLLSGGTEISCTVHAPDTAGRDDLLLHKLPRANRVTAVSAHELLHTFALPDGWSGLHCLSPGQIERLRPPEPSGPGLPPAPEDQPLLDALAHDGRASYTALAAATGWSDSAVRRRMDLLRRHGTLTYHLDVSPARLGFRSETRLWLTVSPAHLAEAGAALASHPETSFAVATTGTTNLTAMVNCRDGRDLYRYLTDRVAGIRGVQTLESAPVIRTVKRAGTPLRRPAARP
ncbi:Lrp/AsnC family transcriptional regulator [Amycolatopsis sp. NPDC058278]|uniref:Lrp/AsnC family transcriptional regulator n=1 Tax=unclassified Amycolatopsis TaxID=2618356 RepID=UPI00255C08A0|nr:Lrp/AsnC family transcriptional regulator [Amycolatopsis sp. DG1A-15b]WIX84340.1 Lrp/AsnC family transcriptional regulator [Amycolatopsis sp. DG1A-15b]